MTEKPFKLYSSSAGSGKTFTLALSYIQLAVKNPLIFRNILAVTFTNKATQEMKTRIIEYLHRLAAGKESIILSALRERLNYSDEKIRQNAALALKNILHNYPLFSVNTIDSYFHKVIQAFARELGLQGGFEIELDHEVVLNDLVERMMLDVGTNRQLTEWLIRFSEVRVDEGRSWDVRQEIKNLAWEIFNEGFKRFETEIKGNREAIPTLLTTVTDVIRRFESELKSCGREALAVMARFDLQVSDFSFASTGVAGYLEKLASGQVIVPGKRVDYALKDPDSLYKKHHPTGPAIVEAYESGLQKILFRIMELFNRQYTRYQTAMAINRYIYTLGLLTDISLKLHDYREENQTLLISDLSDFLRRVINENETPFIYEKTGARYRHFLIDEFQDTSGFQWENFKPLVKNTLAEGALNLAVGDVKQSIYRWRGGNWELLLRQIKDDIGNELIENLSLNTNRRSKKLLIRFFNTIFEQAPVKLKKTILSSVTTMDAALQSAIKRQSDILTEAYGDALQYIPENTEQDPVEGRIKVSFYEDTPDSPWKEQALNALPGMVEELQEHRYVPRDMAILVRTKEEGEEVVECLMNYKSSGKARSDFSYETVSSESLFLTAAHSVKILISAMEYAKKRQNEIALVNLVYEYVKFVKKEDTPPVEELFICAKSPDYVRQNDLLPEIYWNDLLFLQVLPVYEAAEKLIRAFNLKSLPGETAYLQTFLDLILEYASNEKGELAGFLDWWNVTGVNRSIEMPEEIDAIRVMTIHKSKGLQFKAVLIPFCNWNLDHNPMFDNIIWRLNPPAPFNQPGCLPVRYTKALEDTLFNMDYYEEKIKAYIDNLNLAYVAFTRAEDQLVICGCKPSTPSAVNIKSASDLLFALFSEEPEVTAPDPFPRLDLKKSWNETAGIFEAGQAEQTAKITTQAALKLNDFISAGWRDKLSVKFKSGETGASIVSESLKYGTLMHQILSKTATANDLERILKDFYYEGLLTKKALEEIRQKLTAILENEPVKDWFSGRYKLKTEASALSPNGEVRRLDRVMFDKDAAIVVDFKTGGKNTSYNKQVEAYRKLLLKMGYKSVDGYILYLDRAEVEKL